MLLTQTSILQMVGCKLRHRTKEESVKDLDQHKNPSTFVTRVSQTLGNEKTNNIWKIFESLRKDNHDSGSILIEPQV